MALAPLPFTLSLLLSIQSASVSLALHHSHVINAILERWSDDHFLNFSRASPDGWGARGAGWGAARDAEKLSKLGPLPRAPHLENCLHKQRHIEESEQRMTNGDAPPWANPQAPLPPWVRGADSDNLAGTRQAQADLWLHQFPAEASCRKPRLLIVRWAIRKVGIGASIHLMGRALQIALANGRILVPLNGSFPRAEHEACLQFGQWGSLSCYWAPMTSPECEARAANILASIPQPTWREVDVFGGVRASGEEPARAQAMAAAEERLGGSEEFLYCDDPMGMIVFSNWWRQKAAGEGRPLIQSWAKRWGSPWLAQPTSEESLEDSQIRLHVTSDAVKEAKWWSAQSVRFFLRWPSLYLCHLANRVRHNTYGAIVARGVASMLDSFGHFSADPLGSSLVPWSQAEPYILRPILSMHVRQGDKAVDHMKISSVQDFFAAASWKRVRNPDLKYIWLSTEMESAIQEAKAMEGWIVFYTAGVKRQASMGQAMWQAEMAGGLELQVGMSFANLVISAQCDEFVGTLNSNWSRLIDELRKTNGRFAAAITTLSGFPE